LAQGKADQPKFEFSDCCRCRSHRSFRGPDIKLSASQRLRLRGLEKCKLELSPPPPTSNARFSGACAVAALLLIMLLGGCESDAPNNPNQLPRISDLGPPGQAQGAGPRSTTEAPAALVRRIDLPLDDALVEAWALVDGTVLPPVVESWWRPNGLRAGVLDAAGLASFLARLPPAYGVKHLRLVGITQRPAALAFSIVRCDPVALELPVKPAPMTARGQWQFLLRAWRQDGRGGLELVPHHHTPGRVIYVPTAETGEGRSKNKPRVQIRSANHDRLMGEAIEQLTLHAPLASGQTLVVGIDHAAGEPPAAKTGSISLGRALLAIQRAGRRIQVILLLEPEVE
jgi:hypothetical protein